MLWNKRSMPANALRLNLNNPVFQSTLFALDKTRQAAVLSTLRKLAAMTAEDDAPHRPNPQGVVLKVFGESGPDAASLKARWNLSTHLLSLFRAEQLAGTSL